VFEEGLGGYVTPFFLSHKIRGPLLCAGKASPDHCMRNVSEFGSQTIHIELLIRLAGNIFLLEAAVVHYSLICPHN
jgi:hypothetical protein